MPQQADVVSDRLTVADRGSVEVRFCAGSDIGDCDGGRNVLNERIWHIGDRCMAMINVLSIQRVSTEDRAKIEAVDPMIQFIDAGGWYDGEIRETWPAFTSARYLAPNAMGSGTREERDRLLANAEVILGGWPFPLDLRARAPRLKWFHQRPAGASNLLRVISGAATCW
jgi:hypothetical protein